MGFTREDFLRRKQAHEQLGGLPAPPDMSRPLEALDVARQSIAELTADPTALPERELPTIGQGLPQPDERELSGMRSTDPAALQNQAALQYYEAPDPFLPAASTVTANQVLGFINSKPPDNVFEETTSFLTALGTGAIAGLSGLDIESPEAKYSPVGATAGNILGIAASFVPAGRIVRGASVGMKALSPTARRVVGMTLAGSTIEATQQGLRYAVGQQVELDNIMWQGIAFGAGEAALARISKTLKAKPPAALPAEKPSVFGGIVEPTSPSGVGFPANITTVAPGAPGGKYQRLMGENVTAAPNVVLKHPVVSQAERKTMLSVKEPPPAKTETRSALRSINEGIENPIRTHEKFGTKEIIYRPVKEAEKRAVDLSKELDKKFDAMLKENELSGRGSAFGVVSGASERIGTYAVARQAGGKDILAKMGITEIPTLTPTETTAYNWMRNELKAFYRDIQKTRMAAGQQPFAETEDYFTFFRKFEGEIQSGRGVFDLGADALSGPLPNLRMTPFRYGKRRVVDDYGSVGLDSFGIFRAYGHSARKHIELTPTIAKNRQLLDGAYHDGIRLMEAKPEAYRVLSGWNNFVAGADVSHFGQRTEKFMKAMNRNLAFSVLSGNFRSAFIQPSAYVNTFAELGPKYSAMGVADLFNPTSLRFALKHSNVLSGRQYDIAVVEAFSGFTGKVGATRGTVAKFGLKPLQILDMITAQATWSGAYRKAQDVYKLTRREAINFADDVVTRTQASAARSDLAPIQRSAMGKTATLFNTFVINNWGFLTRDAAGIGGRGVMNKESLGKVSRWLMGATLMNYVYEDMLGSFSPFPNPLGAYGRALEKTKSPWAATGSALREMAELVPIAGGGIRYGSNILGAQVDFWGEVSNTMGVGFEPQKSPHELLARGFGVPGTAEAVKRLRRAKRKSKVVKPH